MIQLSMVTDPITGAKTLVENFTDGYTLMDFTLSKRLLKRKLLLSCGIQNILNVTNVARGGAKSSSAHSNNSNTVSIGFGRSFFVNIKFNW